MRTVIATLAGKTFANRPLAIAVAVLLALEGLLAVLGMIAPTETLLRGWLVAFAIWSTVPVGSMTLLMIHRLTGGAWGWAAAPVLRPAAAMTPLVALGFVPVLVALPHIYPWAADPSAIPADVARWYLNGPSFLIRSLIALGGWSLLAIVFATGRGSRLLAGLGLAFFGLTISLVAVDWYLSLEPHYVASAFAAMIAIQQLLAALAITALLGAPTIDGKVAGDLGAFLISDAARRRLSRTHDVRRRMVRRPAGEGGLVPETGQSGMDRRSVGCPFGRRGFAIWHAADQSDTPQPSRLARGRRADPCWHHPAYHLAAGAGLRLFKPAPSPWRVPALPVWRGLSLFIGSALGSVLGPPLEVRHAE